MCTIAAYKQAWDKTRRLGKAGLRSLLQTFLATGCAVCDRSTSQIFCLDCSRQIEAECYPAKSPLAKAKALKRGLNPEYKFSEHKFSVIALGTYRGSLKQAILALKYKDRPQVAQQLGVALAQRWQSQREQWPRSLCIIPIPLHPNRLAQRGYNQAALIARAFAQSSGLPLAERALLRCKDTKPQHQLGPVDRQENLVASFKLSAAWKRRLLTAQEHPGVCPSVVLIDDIYTTGATALSAAMTLRSAGLDVVGILVLARAASD